MTINKMPGDELTPHEIAAFAAAAKKSTSDPLAHELGHFLFAWNGMETSVSILLRKLTQTPDAFDYLNLAGSMDVYAKTKALLAAAGRQQRPQGWLEQLKVFQKRLDGPLREKRNRFIHDTWLVEDTGFTKVHYRPRAATADTLPSVLHDATITLSEIQAAYAEIVLAGLLLKRLHEQLP